MLPGDGSAGLAEDLEAQLKCRRQERAPLLLTKGVQYSRSQTSGSILALSRGSSRPS